MWIKKGNSVTMQLHFKQINIYAKIDIGEKKVDKRIYSGMVSSLLYLSASRPDIMFATSYLSRVMQSPSQLHLRVEKRLLRYVKDTLRYGVQFEVVTTSLKVVGLTDIDWVSR